MGKHVFVSKWSVVVIVFTSERQKSFPVFLYFFYFPHFSSFLSPSLAHFYEESFCFSSSVKRAWQPTNWVRAFKTKADVKWRHIANSGKTPRNNRNALIWCANKWINNKSSSQFIQVSRYSALLFLLETL